jgi:hypothetical protein
LYHESKDIWIEGALRALKKISHVAVEREVTRKRRSSLADQIEEAETAIDNHTIEQPALAAVASRTANTGG